MKKNQFQPKYILVKEAILEKIRGKFFPDNSFMPPEAELMKTFKVSRNTVRTALKSLREDGIVTSSQGQQSRIDASKILEKKQRGRIAWLHTEYLNEGVYFEIFKYMANCAEKKGFALEYINMDFESSGTNFIRNIDSYAGTVITGRITKNGISPEAFKILSNSKNIVAIDNVEELPAKLAIGTDNRKGLEMAVKHFVDNGRKKIAFLGISPAFYSYKPFEERFMGYQNAVKKYSLPADRGLCVVSDEVKDSYCVRQVLEKLLKKHPDVDGICTITDFIAIQTIYTLKDMDIKVPFDISVTGFDGLSSGEYTSPKLTTIAQPFEVIANTVIDNIMKGDLPSKPKFIPVKPNLIIRES